MGSKLVKMVYKATSELIRNGDQMQLVGFLRDFPQKQRALFWLVI